MAWEKNKLLRITNITELDRRTVHLVTVVNFTWLKIKIELLKMVKFFPMTVALGKEEKLGAARELMLLRFVNTFLGIARDSGVVSVGF